MGQIVKGNLKKKYDLLKRDHEKLLSEAIVAGNLIQYLKKKISEYDAVLEADPESQAATIVKQEQMLNKYRELVDVKDQIIADKDKKISKLKERMNNIYGKDSAEVIFAEIEGNTAGVLQQDAGSVSDRDNELEEQKES